MPTLMQEMTATALRLGVPISVQLDVTYRCNERCVHCYLDHDDHGEMTPAEIRDVLDQMAEAGVFFLTISGGEVLMRMDFFDILAHARARMFSVKVKTNAFMIREKEADRLARAGLARDRKSTRLNSSHSQISYAVFCLKKKKKQNIKYTVTQDNYE